MTPSSPPPVREADDIVAPFVFAYIFGAVASIAALLAWVYWYRGYA